jgi:hypothetical protein
MSIVAGDGGVDLHRHAQTLQIAETGNGGIERARNPAEGIMSSRIGAIEADGHALYAAVDDHARNVLGHQRAVCRQRNSKTLVRAIARQLENIGTEEWFAPAQHQNGSRHGSNLVDDIARRFGREIRGSA